MDKLGADTLIDVIKSLEQNRIAVGLVSCPLHVIELLERTDFFKKMGKRCVFPTIHDAVITLR